MFVGLAKLVQQLEEWDVSELEHAKERKNALDLIRELGIPLKSVQWMRYGGLRSEWLDFASRIGSEAWRISARPLSEGMLSLVYLEGMRAGRREHDGCWEMTAEVVQEILDDAERVEDEVFWSGYLEAAWAEEEGLEWRLLRDGRIGWSE